MWPPGGALSQVLSQWGARRGPGGGLQGRSWREPRHPTCAPFMSFMLMAFFAPLAFSFFFFFLQQHFLQTQKQQVSSSRPATTAMATSAQGGTAPRGRPGQRRLPRSPARARGLRPPAPTPRI